MTYKQAQSVGAQVRRGEKGTLVQYWKLTDQIAVKDERGKPLKDAEGNTVYRTVQLEKPKVFSAVVFNAEQIEGLPALAVKAPDWDRHERAEAVLKASGVEIRHDQADRAFYRPATDRIHLPARDSFKSADTYYATALHELAHASGHPSRLDRDLAHPFGSVGYAKEELRAEIASLMIGDRLGIGHDPGQHAAYVKSWVQVLKEDPKEILRASTGCGQDRRLRAGPGEGSSAGKHRQAAANGTSGGPAASPEGARRCAASPQGSRRVRSGALSCAPRRGPLPLAVPWSLA